MLSIRQVGIALGIVFAVSLAVVVVKQMSNDAMAVVIGVVCGVASSIPTTVLLTWVVTRRDRQSREEAERRAQDNRYPPVVVIQGGTPQRLPGMPEPAYWPPPAPGPVAGRRFRVVGGDDLLEDGLDRRG